MDWAYRVTGDKAKIALTLEIIDAFGFLWRNLYKTYKTTHHLIPNVQHINIGDMLFVYFPDEYPILSCKVQKSGKFKKASDRAPAILKVDAEKDEKLHNRLYKAAYPKDPYLKCYVGFEVIEVENMDPPGKPHFGGRNAIGKFIT